MKLFNIKKELLPIALILIILAVGLYFYPQLPDRVPTHWGVNGEINGWSSKTFAVFFFPAFIAILYILLSILPLMDPLKTNIELFAGLYFWFKAAFVLFMGALYLMTIYAGLGHEINVGQYVMWGIALLFLFLGWMMPKIKKNYTIGIRLPWTLHSEVVWDKAHILGGQLFMALAVLIAIVSFFPGPFAFWALLGGIILLLAVLVIYSWRQYVYIEKGRS